MSANSVPTLRQTGQSEYIQMPAAPCKSTALGAPYMSTAVLARELWAALPIKLRFAKCYLFSLERCTPLLREMYDLLSEDEKSRARSYAHPGRRARFIAGRAVLRAVLPTHSRHEDDDTAQPRADAPAACGRPPPDHAAHNLSYSGDLIALAVSGRDRVGIDIEVNFPILAAEIPHHLLSAAEIRLLRGVADPVSSPTFLAIWTMKEAVAKALGKGLADRFADIDTCALSCSTDPCVVVAATGVSGSVFHQGLRIGGERYFFSLTTCTDSACSPYATDG